MSSGRGAKMTGALALVTCALALVTGCGATIGDLGAAAQAEKDLRPPSSGANRGPRVATDDGARPVRGECDVVPDGAEGWSVTCDGDGLRPGATAGASATTGSWVWVSPSTVASTPTDGSADGAWYWMMADGRLVTVDPTRLALGQEPGRWFWVTDAASVSTDRRLMSGGAWYLLASPAQVSQSPLPGSIYVPPPGGSGPGWYWRPAEGSTEGPVTGGRGAAPSAPSAPSAPTAGRRDDTASGPAGGGEPAKPNDDGPTTCQPPSAPPDASVGANGWLRSQSGQCAVPLQWASVTVDRPGRVSASVRLVVRRSETLPPSGDEVMAVVVDVVGRRGPAANVALSVGTPSGTADGSAIATDASAMCPAGGRGVELSGTLPLGEGKLSDPQLLVCDAATAAALLDP